MSGTTGELFAGAGGLGMAVDEVFASRPAWVAEIEAAPSKVLAARYPDVPNLGDVTAIDYRAAPHTSIRCGGFPCQDVSLAGRRRGMKGGTRSGLWSEFRRSIEEDRPDWVVIENVRGLLSAHADGDVEPCAWCLGNDGEQHALRALGAVLGDLADLGFDAEWTGIRASDVGAPHGRFRVFILAWPSERTVTHTSGSGSRGWAARPQSGGRDNAPVGSDSGRDGRRADHGGVTLLPTPTVVMNDGESVESWQARNARLRAKGINGNGMGTPLPIAVQLLPTPDAYAGSRGGAQDPDKRSSGGHAVSLADVAEHKLLPTPTTGNATGGNAQCGGARGDEKLLPGVAVDIAEGKLLPTPRATDGTKGAVSRTANTDRRLDEGRATLSDAAVSTTNWGPYAAAIRRWELVLGRPAPSPVRMDGRGGKARLNPEFVEWMMGWPAGWVTAPELGLSRADQLKIGGNGVVTLQAVVALRMMLAREGVPAA